MSIGNIDILYTQNLSGTSISAETIFLSGSNITNLFGGTGTSVNGNFLSLSGGTVTGNTNFSSNLSATTFVSSTATTTYLYSAENNLLIGNITQNKNVGIFVGSSTATTVDFSSGKTTFNKPIYSGNSEISTLFPYDVSKYRTIGTSTLERWYCSANINSTLNSATLSTNVLRFVPFIISNRTTVDRIGIEVAVSGSSASNARLGIYDVSGGTIPNN